MRTARGQASVETVAVLPLVFLLAVVGLQALVWAASAVEVTSAAAAGARAAARGDDAQSSARAALPGVLRAGASVSVADGSVRVSVAEPSLIPHVPRLRLEAVER